jgi:hypothetical protein
MAIRGVSSTRGRSDRAAKSRQCRLRDDEPSPPCGCGRFAIGDKCVGRGRHVRARVRLQGPHQAPRRAAATRLPAGRGPADRFRRPRRGGRALRRRARRVPATRDHAGLRRRGRPAADWRARSQARWRRVRSKSTPSTTRSRRPARCSTATACSCSSASPCATGNPSPTIDARTPSGCTQSTPAPAPWREASRAASTCAPSSSSSDAVSPAGAGRRAPTSRSGAPSASRSAQRCGQRALRACPLAARPGTVAVAFASGAQASVSGDRVGALALDELGARGPTIGSRSLPAVITRERTWSSVTTAGRPNQARDGRRAGRSHCVSERKRRPVSVWRSLSGLGKGVGVDHRGEHPGPARR